MLFVDPTIFDFGALPYSPSLMLLMFMMIVIIIVHRGGRHMTVLHSALLCEKNPDLPKKRPPNIFNKPWVLDRNQRTARADCKSDLHDFVSGEASTPRIFRYLAEMFNVYYFFSLWTKFVNFQYILCIFKSLFSSGAASTPRILRYLAAIFNVYDFFSFWTKFVNFQYILCISSSLFSSGEASTPAVLLSLSIGIGTKAPYCCFAHHHLCIISNNAIIAITS